MCCLLAYRLKHFTRKLIDNFSSDPVTDQLTRRLRDQLSLQQGLERSRCSSMYNARFTHRTPRTTRGRCCEFLVCDTTNDRSRRNCKCCGQRTPLPTNNHRISTLHRVSINDTPLASYNFDTHESILIFLAGMLIGKRPANRCLTSPP